MAARRCGVAHHHEDPGLAVLGAGGEGGGIEHLLHGVVVDGIVAEDPARALAVHDLEDVLHAPHATAGPARGETTTAARRREWRAASRERWWPPSP